MATRQMDRRRSTRQAAPQVGLIGVYAVQANQECRFIGNSLLYDVSDAGVSVILDDSLPCGIKVRLANRTTEYLGVTCNCSPTEVGFKVGIALMEVN